MLLSHQNEVFGIISLHPLESVEVEVRFNYITGGEIPLAIFDRLRGKLDLRVEPVVESYKDERHGLIRRTTDDKFTVGWIRKEQLRSYKFNEYAFSLNVSLETVPEPPDNFSPVTIRHKKRYSYLLPKVRVDLTYVDQTLVGSDTSNRVEIEIELLDLTPSGYQILSDVTEQIFTMLYDTELMYTIDDRRAVISYTNQILTGNSGDPDTLALSGIPQARNLKWDDLKNGHLIGGRERYIVYHKVDGFRKLLVVAPNGVWLMYPPYDLNLISRTYRSDTVGAIMDAEEIPYSRRIQSRGPPKAKYWVMITDLVSIGGNQLEDPYDIRMVKAQTVANTLKDPDLLYVTTHMFRDLITVDIFFEVMRSLFIEKSDLMYEDDGFVFKPLKSKFQPHSDKHPVSMRDLSKMSDILKWKPSDKLTIDLTLFWLNSGNQSVPELRSRVHTEQPYLYKDGKPLPVDVRSTLLIDGQVIKFKFDRRRYMLSPLMVSKRKQPHSKSEIDKKMATLEDRMSPDIVFDCRVRIQNGIPTLYSSSIDLIPFKEGDLFVDDSIRKIESGTVVELQYNVDKNKLELYRARYDKQFPNQDDIAKDNWNMIKDPITQQTLEGKTFDLLCKELNRIVSSYVIRETLVVSDQITATHFKRYVKSCDLLSVTDKFDRIIMDRSVDQYFGDRQNFTSLIKWLHEHLNIGGYLTVVSLDGQAISHLFNPKIRGPVYQKIKLAPVELQLDGNVLKIDKPIAPFMRDSVPLVLLRSFLMNGFSVTPREIGRVDYEPFMRDAERSLGDLFMYAHLKLVEAPKIDISTIIEPIKKETVKCDVPVKKITDVGGRIPFMKVTVRYDHSGQIKDEPALNDDKISTLACSWWNNVVRISVIGDGSCLIHAILKACYNKYQEDGSAKYRSELTRSFRDQLAVYLEDIYQTIGKGVFPSFAEQQLLDPALIKGGIDYSLPGLQKLLKSSDSLGDELYKVIGEALEVDIYILRGTSKDLSPYINTSERDRSRRSVVIMGQGAHYETIGITTDTGIQTIFNADHPFLVEIRKFQTDEEGYQNKIGEQRIVDKPEHTAKTETELLYL